MGNKIARLENPDQQNTTQTENDNNLDIISHQTFGTMAVFNKAKAVQFQGQLQIMDLYDMQFEIGDMHLAHNSTFIIEQKLDNKICLTHCSAKGEYIKNLVFQDCQLQTEMVRQNVCIILQKSSINQMAQLYLWNLQNNNVINCGCWKLKKRKSKINFFVFPQQGLFCVYIISQFGQNSTVSLIYYKQDQSSPLYTQHINVKGRASQVGIKKLDNSSLIAIYESVFVQKENTTIKLMLVSLTNSKNDETAPACKKEMIEMSCQFIKNPQFGTFVRVLDVWRISEGVLYICFESLEKYRNQMMNNMRTNSICALKVKQNKIYSFIWKYNKGLYKPMKLQPNQDHIIQFVGQNRTKKHYKFDQKLPIYYVDKVVDKKENAKQIQLLAVEMKMPKQEYNVQRTVPAYNPQVELIYYEQEFTSLNKQIQTQGETKNKKIKYLIRQIQKTYQFKYSQVIAFWMTSLIKNCDDGLLQSITDLLIQ